MLSSGRREDSAGIVAEPPEIQFPRLVMHAVDPWRGVVGLLDFPGEGHGAMLLLRLGAGDRPAYWAQRSAAAVRQLRIGIASASEQVDTGAVRTEVKRLRDGAILQIDSTDVHTTLVVARSVMGVLMTESAARLETPARPLISIHPRAGLSAVISKLEAWALEKTAEDNRAGPPSSWTLRPRLTVVVSQRPRKGHDLGRDLALQLRRIRDPGNGGSVAYPMAGFAYVRVIKPVTQSLIPVVVVLRGPVPTDPDYPALLLASHVLGGSGAGYLDRELRFHDRSSFGFRSQVRIVAGRSAIVLRGAIHATSARSAITHLRQRLDDLGTIRLLADDWRRARSVVLHDARRRLESRGGAAAMIARCHGDGMGFEFSQNLIHRIPAVSPNELEQVWRRCLPGQATTIVALDGEEVVTRIIS